jgi:hypothetical protein
MATEQKNVPVVLYTAHHRIEGEILLLKGEHLSDKLNLTERKFEAILQARVYSLAGNHLVHEAPCVAVNKDHVELVTPASAEEPAP